MLDNIRTAARRMVPVTVLVMGGAFVFGACDSSTTPIPPDQWDAEIAGSGAYEDIAGAAGITAGATSFTAAIEIEGAEPDAVYGWRVAQGTCEEPGDSFGDADDYADLEVDDEGEASQTANVSGVLQANGTYHVHLLDESGDEPVVAACGDLSRQ